MLDKKYLATIRKEFHNLDRARRGVLAMSAEAQHHAKRAIFSLHRGDTKGAEEKLREAKALFISLEKQAKKQSKLAHEGAYRAGLEEYAEAVLFFQFLSTGKMGKIPGVSMPDEVYLTGLSDVPGELYRYAIRAATSGNTALVKKCADAANEILSELTEFNLTNYLRTKCDQAKQALQKLETIMYDLSLRQ